MLKGIKDFKLTSKGVKITFAVLTAAAFGGAYAIYR